MLVADDFLGTVDDGETAARLAEADPLTVTVGETERRRSRFRTTADDGTDLGVVVARELGDGDVLDAGEHFVVVELEPVEAMVLDFHGTAGEAAALTAAVELGHAVGNRHWDLAVEGDRVYLPAAESRERMESTVDPHLIDGVDVGYEDVSPTLFDGERGHGGHDHSHGGGGHGHSHEGDGRDHSHADEHNHSHGDRGDSHGHGHGDHSHDDGMPIRSLDPDDAGSTDAGGGES